MLGKDGGRSQNWNLPFLLEGVPRALAPEDHLIAEVPSGRRRREFFVFCSGGNIHL